MDFSRHIDAVHTDIQALNNLLTISSLPALCNSIEKVITDHGDTGTVFTVWGQLDLTREQQVTGTGFRFTTCPHKFNWLITFDKDRHALDIFASTIDDDLDPEFQKTIEQFMTDFEHGLRNSPLCNA